MTWEKTAVEFRENITKVYTNKNNTQAVVFPPFGKYFSVRSDRSAFDLALSFIFLVPNREVSYSQYLSSQEETAIIHQDVA